ncbi:hypothetical protein [Stieleria marina]|uniref:hypothetical protein n=1 Tax=Stieleria marina TaxID=1930275 RepID=UPI003AF3BEAD
MIVLLDGDVRFLGEASLSITSVDERPRPPSRGNVLSIKMRDTRLRQTTSFPKLSPMRE